MDSSLSPMKKIFRNVLAVALAGTTIIGILYATEASPKMIKPEDMQVICYSCGRGENPENSLEGIGHCLSVNPNWRIEMDIQITADNVLVLFHDDNTVRTTGEDFRINDLTIKEVKKLNAGFNFKSDGTYPNRNSFIRIPELREVFQKYPEAKLLLDIHTNNPKVVELFIELIETKFKHGDFIVVSQYDAIIEQLRKERPHWTYGVPANEAKKLLYSSFLYLDGLFPIKSDLLLLPKKYGNINVLSKRVVNHAKKRNIPIWAWMYEGEYVKTVESKIEMEELGKIGVNGIFTEFPQKLSNELQ